MSHAANAVAPTSFRTSISKHLASKHAHSQGRLTPFAAHCCTKCLVLLPMHSSTTYYQYGY